MKKIHLRSCVRNRHFSKALLPTGVQWRQPPRWKSRLCVRGHICSVSPLYASWRMVPIALRGRAVAVAGTCVPQASRVPAGLDFTYLFFSKCIWARKVTVLAASPFTRECFFHLQAATCVRSTRDSVRSEKHWFFFFFHCILHVSKGRPLPSAKVQCSSYALDPQKSSKYSTEACFVCSPAQENCCRATRVSKLPPIGRFIPRGILGTVKPS